MQYLIFSGENLKKGAEIALAARLYVPVKSFMMKSWYKGIISEYYGHFESIVIVMNENKPIAAGIRPKFEHSAIGVYVKPKYRRKGIGRGILQTLVGHNYFFWLSGLKGSGDFYRKYEQQVSTTKKLQEYD